MATMIAKGKTGLFYATDSTRGGMLVAARSIEEAYSRVVSAVRLLDAGGKGPPLDGHDILETDDGTLITVPHSSWQTRLQAQETRSLLIRLVMALPAPPVHALWLSRSDGPDFAIPSAEIIS